MYGNLGTIRSWATQNGHELIKIRLFDSDKLPDIDDIDMLISMGGLQRVSHIEKYDYLLTEVELIKHCIAQEKKVLGICLGAQLISKALGTEPEVSPEPEMGYFTLQFTSAGKNHHLLSQASHPITPLSWHQDMSGLPKNATVLAYTERCPRQIIEFNENTYGIQCHMEATPKTAKMITSNYPHDIEGCDFTAKIREIEQNDSRQANLFLSEFLTQWTTQI